MASAVLEGVVPGDTVTLDSSNARGEFASATVGTAKPVAITGLVLTGAQAAGYTLVPPTLTANITPRPITVVADSAGKREGDSDPALTWQVTVGTLVSGDSLTGALDRVPGETPGTYAIRQGTLSTAANYTLTFESAIFTIRTANLAPVAADDTFATDEATALEVTAPGVLTNDSDADGTPLTASVVTLPSHGTLALRPDGGFSYTPGSGFLGTDQFTYRAADALTNSTPATVTISVNAAVPTLIVTNEAVITLRRPAAPLDPLAGVRGTRVAGGRLVATLTEGAEAGDTLSILPDADEATGLGVAGDRLTLAGQPLAAITVDDEGWSLEIQFAEGATRAGLETVVRHLAFASPGPSLEPRLVQLSFLPANGEAAAPVAISILLNQPPSAQPDHKGTTQDQPRRFALASLLANDTDPEGHSLRIDRVDTSSTQGGTIEVVDGLIEYRPPAGFIGADTFSYRLLDERGGDDLGTVHVHVLAAGDLIVSEVARDAEAQPTQARLLAASPPGRTFDVYASTDFVNWTFLGVATANANGIVEFLDAEVKKNPSRFYQLRERR